MCACTKEKEWFFTVAGTEYKFKTHSQAVAARRKLGQSNAAAKAVPLAMRTIDKPK